VGEDRIANQFEMLRGDHSAIPLRWSGHVPTLKSNHVSNARNPACSK
jgi:hypothetical protein